ncbi:MAG: S26 family signal peptidase [Treponema sp.]|nr:S26 family signal peptidase [Treponema sp.]
MAKMSMTKAAAGAFAAAFVMKLFLFDFIVAEGNSMEPSIHSGTVLLVNRMRYGLRLPGQREYLFRWAGPRPGEVLVFFTPSGQLAVKRCGELVDRGNIMALGDNSLQSYDSRSYGPVPVENIIGKVLGVK